MERRSIGDIEFSIVGLGGYEFEDDPDWPAARDVLLAAAEVGIDWVDTAETYFDGGSERTIGAALRDTGVSMRISSKVGPARGGTGPDCLGRYRVSFSWLPELKTGSVDISWSVAGIVEFVDVPVVDDAEVFLSYI